MPIEIKELIIRFAVDDKHQISKKDISNMQQTEKQLVERCVERVLKILEAKTER